MTTLATGAGLIGTELARCALKRGQAVVFVDPKPAPLDISRARQHLRWEPRFTIASAFADYLAELKQARGAEDRGGKSQA